MQHVEKAAVCYKMGVLPNTHKRSLTFRVKALRHFTLTFNAVPMNATWPYQYFFAVNVFNNNYFMFSYRLTSRHGYITDGAKNYTSLSKRMWLIESENR